MHTMERLFSVSLFRPGPLLALGTFLALLPPLVVAYDGRDLLRVTVLALPVWLVLWRPHPKPWVRACQVLGALLLALLFLLDSVARGFILQAFGAAPDSTMVMTALANTTPAETSEFLSAHGPRLMQWGAAFAGLLGLQALLLRAWWQAADRPVHMGKGMARLLVALLVLLALALALKPWRSFHPLAFWPAWAQNVDDLRRQWHNLDLQRENLRQHAQMHAPVLTPGSPETLVLVLSDSINRENLSLYGYPRPTTPRLEARQHVQSQALQVFRHAWSTQASTVPALRQFFHLTPAHDDQRQHLLTLAAAAGYRTTWISNHDDRAVYQEHALLAERTHTLNHVPGRSTASLDHQVLPLLENALQQPHERKLIVVHLLGAHPHYSRRYPPGQAPFRGVQDAVYHSLKQEGRPLWVRKLRNEYDSALHYHDTVVDQTLELTRRWGGQATWVYLSDHGQEVGGSTNHAGHSATLADGYRIPLMMWSSAGPSTPTDVHNRPVRSDWLGHSMTRLLGLSWKGYRADRDVLSPYYRWQVPPLPMQVDYLS